MNRLQAQWQRLYLPPEGAAAGTVRAVVLGLARPASWDDAAAVWQGAQTDLGLPAPGIAVSGTDACELWFSLAQPVDAADAQAFMDGLASRYLAHLPPHALRARLAPGTALPPAQVGAERWSAFVSPDLAPLFAEEPFLDHPPGADAQAELLSRLECAGAEVFAHALTQLAAAPAATPVTALATPVHAPAGPADPRAFLTQVMQDASVPLALRIEAAKALLATARA